MTTCQYFDEDEFVKKDRMDKNTSVSSPLGKEVDLYTPYTGWIFNSLKTKFEVIVSTKIGGKNISVVENLIPDYNFSYVLLTKNKCSGVGI